EIFLRPLMDQLPSHHHQSRRNRTAKLVELIFANITVSLQEVVLLEKPHYPHQYVRIGIDGFQFGGLEDASGDLLRPQARERKRGELSLLPGRYGMAGIGGAAVELKHTRRDHDP